MDVSASEKKLKMDGPKANRGLGPNIGAWIIRIGFGANFTEPQKSIDNERYGALGGHLSAEGCKEVKVKPCRSLTLSSFARV